MIAERLSRVKWRNLEHDQDISTLASSSPDRTPDSPADPWSNSIHNSYLQIDVSPVFMALSLDEANDDGREERPCNITTLLRLDTFL
jgi:hypothetical protein